MMGRDEEHLQEKVEKECGSRWGREEYRGVANRGIEPGMIL